MCDVCKAPIRNLPAITPRAPSDGASDGEGFDPDDRAHTPGPLFLGEQMPGSADIVFDCIRVRALAGLHWPSLRMVKAFGGSGCVSRVPGRREGADILIAALLGCIGLVL